MITSKFATNKNNKIKKNNMKNFTIEKVKWKWAKEVQSPNVYRDDEFVRTKTKEEALDAIEFLFGTTHNGVHHYTITVERDGEFFTYNRTPMPCLGGLCKYRDSHGPKYSNNPYFPRDIYVAFPEGEIVFIGCYRAGAGDILKNPYGQFIFSPESPWVSAFGKKETVIFKPNYLVLTNMDTDPTVFYSIMRLGGLLSGYAAGFNSKNNPKASILLSTNGGADPRRIAGQKPIKISGGMWSGGWGFTRPFNESIFKTCLPKKYEDFKDVGGYPNAPFTNEYFKGVMKNKFKVDPGNCQIGKQNQKLYDALVDAWDYFKEASKELGTGFPD